MVTSTAIFRFGTMACGVRLRKILKVSILLIYERMNDISFERAMLDERVAVNPTEKLQCFWKCQPINVIDISLNNKQ